MPSLNGDEPYIIYDLSDISDYSAAQKIERSSNYNFKNWIAMAHLPWIEKEPIIAIAEKLAKFARTPKEMRETFLMPKIWSDYGHKDYSAEIKKEMEKHNKAGHQTCIEVLEYYREHLREDQMVCPTLKVFTMKRALITNGSLQTFLNLRIAKNWETAVEVSLREIDWPVEKWQSIIDSSVPKKFKIIAQEKIVTIRKAGSNQQLIFQA
jgi:hypothetical protein